MGAIRGVWSGVRPHGGRRVIGFRRSCLGRCFWGNFGNQTAAPVPAASSGAVGRAAVLRGGSDELACCSSRVAMLDAMGEDGSACCLGLLHRTRRCLFAASLDVSARRLSDVGHQCSLLASLGRVGGKWRTVCFATVQGMSSLPDASGVRERVRRLGWRRLGNACRAATAAPRFRGSGLATQVQLALNRVVRERRLCCCRVWRCLVQMYAGVVSLGPAIARGPVDCLGRGRSDARASRRWWGGWGCV